MYRTENIMLTIALQMCESIVLNQDPEMMNCYQKITIITITS